MGRLSTMGFILIVIMSIGISCAESKCFDGFKLVPGSIPGKSTISVSASSARARARGEQKREEIATDETGCALLCTTNNECCSYEHSEEEEKCQLNKECSPNAEEVKGYKFCVKD